MAVDEGSSENGVTAHKGFFKSVGSTAVLGTASLARMLAMEKELLPSSEAEDEQEVIAPLLLLWSQLPSLSR